MEHVKILIVEDEEVIAMGLKIILVQEGYSICGIVSTGEEAVEMVLQARPHLVLMAIRLRGRFDGIAAYEQIKKHANVPAVFISTYADKETIERAMATKASGYIVKPFKVYELTEHVKAALTSRIKSENWPSYQLMENRQLLCMGDV